MELVSEVMMTFYYLLIILITVVFSFKTKKRHYKNLPPTPPSLPIIGHLHLVKPPLHRALRNLSTKYGDVFSLGFGFRQVVVVSSPSVVEECFTKNDVVLANRPQLLAAKHIGYNSTNMVDTPYGDHWRNLRRIGATEIFSSGRLNLFVGIRRDEVKRLLFKLSHHKDWQKVELKSMLQELLYNILMRMVAGKRCDNNDMRYLESCIRACRSRELGGDFLPFLNWIPNSFEKKVKKVGKKLDSLVEGLIKEHRSSRDKNRNTIIEHLLSLQESQPEYYTDQIIKGFVLVIFAAGMDTSATLEWVMANLLNYPHVLKKVKDEIDSQIGPLLVPHYSSNDCTISRYDVPHGTILLVNAWATHRDPKLWKDADSFIPERFENINSENNEGYKLMPFGLGRRACPGKSLAQRMMGLTLGSLIQCFDWKRIDDNEIDMVEGKGLTMPKAVPLEAMCKPRPIMEFLL
ncbi:hypothetical protein G4B88_028892 [Cannabis sativa]|uniref:Cytochrome P450 n=1 Tax=Cannabis sativa TaxID=3483 RepID=A0A7J6HPC4_CANSA|nr:hypothetical protein G4B88_028892 [Cannabis sativa]